MFIPLGGDNVYNQIDVTTTPVEVKVGGSKHSGRQVVTIRPLNGDLWLGYSNAVSSTNGTPIIEMEFVPIEATEQSSVWIVADSGTVRVAIAEL